MAGRQGRRYFGNARKLPSGRHQARYTGPDGVTYKAPVTFSSQGDADAWLALRHSEILRGAWLPPASPKPAPVLFGPYATAWLAGRRRSDGRDLAPTTRDHYTQLLRDHLTPTFGQCPLTAITPAAVREWHARLKTGPTARAHAYMLLSSILATAVDDEAIPASPCRMRGAGRAKRARRVQPASLAELETITQKVPTRYRLMILLAAWCALRFGELAEMRRADIDMRYGIVHVRRGVTRSKGRRIVSDPKSEAGKRPVAIPPHLMPFVKAHLREHVAPARNALLFPSAHDPARQLAPSALYRVYYPARKAAGRPDLRFHDLRHTGATLAAVSGATLKELMSRLGHSTPAAAMVYQHVAADRDRIIAEALSKLAADVIPVGRNSEKTG